LQNFEIRGRLRSDEEVVVLELRREEDCVEVLVLEILLPDALVLEMTVGTVGLGRGQGVRMTWPQP
jgi:hypothetical protein